MPTTHMAKKIRSEQMPGIEVFQISEEVSAGVPQQVLVVAQPNARIPLHTHSVDAKMIIVSGDGTILSHDDSNGQYVSKGSIVFFECDVAHGFDAGSAGMSFISINGGIVDKDVNNWDISFA